MTDWSLNTRELMLGTVRTTIDEIRLHSGNPGTAGTANQITGGGYSPASVATSAFSAVSAGAFGLAADIEFDGPPAQSVTWATLWAGSTYRGRGRIVGDTAFNSEGKFVLTSATTRFDLDLAPA